eukprot:5709917-Prymnesium_polylepis.2
MPACTPGHGAWRGRWDVTETKMLVTNSEEPAASHSNRTTSAATRSALLASIIGTPRECTRVRSRAPRCARGGGSGDSYPTTDGRFRTYI